MGVALLGGFGDLNVDRSSKEGDKAAAAAKMGGASTALALQSSDLLKLRVPELKKKLVGAGVDLAKYPGAVEKKVWAWGWGNGGGFALELLCRRSMRQEMEGCTAGPLLFLKSGRKI